MLNLAQVNHPSLSIGASQIITNAAVNGTRNNLSEFTIDGAPDMQKSGNTAYTPSRHDGGGGQSADRNL